MRQEGLGGVHAGPLAGPFHLVLLDPVGREEEGNEVPPLSRDRRRRDLTPPEREEEFGYSRAK